MPIERSSSAGSRSGLEGRLEGGLAVLLNRTQHADVLKDLKTPQVGALCRACSLSALLTGAGVSCAADRWFKAAESEYKGVSADGGG